MTKDKLSGLQDLALKVREHIIEMTAGGGCFIGASLSCVELMVYLYAEYLNIDSSNLQHPERDYLFLSKGHDVPALYGTLAELGFIEKARLKQHLLASDSIYWHPNRAIPGVEFHSGSLGHLPAVAAGVAMDCKLKGLQNRVVVITGDGELNEGSVWESLLVANAYGLNNLTILVDRNQFQANIRTEELIPLEPLVDKFTAFGCAVKRINGHDFDALEEAFLGIPFTSDRVNVIIADTVRGKGLPSIEARADRWFCAFSATEISQLLEELHGNKEARIESESLIVR
ncbi:transketolase [Chitinophaga ginsengisoli]|uniref:Transketolase subunit A n=1 Tax=Chitinophaga ginsengisoli TaxID=363837 RepID=A0A2P8GNN4_9BACT|nr:thiamine pyrophosphate-dependent enzyme [Chitinophaga ginsengisoli]PSL35554.1 transketolase subunit A [Chitinophaga ginsengisoli]